MGKLGAAIEEMEAASASPAEAPDGRSDKLPFEAENPKFSWANSQFRAQRLPYDHPGFAGRTLAPLGVLEGAR
jgi:hypothetical protein